MQNLKLWTSSRWPIRKCKKWRFAGISSMLGYTKVNKDKSVKFRGVKQMRLGKFFRSSTEPACERCYWSFLCAIGKIMSDKLSDFIAICELVGQQPEQYTRAKRYLGVSRRSSRLFTRLPFGMKPFHTNSNFCLMTQLSLIASKIELSTELRIVDMMSCKKLFTMI